MAYPKYLNSPVVLSLYVFLTAAAQCKETLRFVTPERGRQSRETLMGRTCEVTSVYVLFSDLSELRYSFVVILI